MTLHAGQSSAGLVKRMVGLLADMEYRPCTLEGKALTGKQINDTRQEKDKGMLECLMSHKEE